MLKISERKAALATLIQLLREERLRQSLSQYEIAARSGISHTTVLRMEKGSHVPSYDTLLAIAEALGIDLGQLVSRSVELVRKTKAL